MVYTGNETGGMVWMLIFSKAKLAFLAVPKTGTTAYQLALRDHADLVISGPPELKHAPLYRYNRFIRPMFEKVCGTDLDVLAVMRDPMDWLGSWYRYRQRPALSGHPNSTQEVSFEAFLLAHLDQSPPPFANVGRQSKFLEARPNGVQVSYLFDYRDQSGLQNFLQDRLNVSFSLDRQNVSPPARLTVSTEVEDKLRRDRAEDFALFESIGR